MQTILLDKISRKHTWHKMSDVGDEITARALAKVGMLKMDEHQKVLYVADLECAEPSPSDVADLQALSDLDF